MEKKRTKRENFEFLLNIDAVKENADLVDFIKHEIELLDNKKSAPRKPTANQVANEGLKNAMFDALADADKPLSIKMLKEVCPEIAGETSQKIAPLLNAMAKDGKVVKTYIKKVAYFGLPDADAE